MIGCVSQPVHFDVTNPAGQIFRDKDEIAAIRTLLPLRVIVNAAGRLMQAARTTERPGIAIVQAGPR